MTAPVMNEDCREHSHSTAAATSAVVPGRIGVASPASRCASLNAMEAAGLITRRRDPQNRRVHLVELTPDGDALFFRLRAAATAFDKKLRSGLSEADIARFEELLDRLRDNVA
jgi:MarR family transcriptional regulator for hemolysin